MLKMRCCLTQLLQGQDALSCEPWIRLSSCWLLGQWPSWWVKPSGRCCFRRKVRTDSGWNFRTMSKNLMMSPHVDNQSRHMVAEGFAGNSGRDRAPHLEPLPEPGQVDSGNPQSKEMVTTPHQHQHQRQQQKRSTATAPAAASQQTITESSPHINSSLSLYTYSYLFSYVCFFFACFVLRMSHSGHHTPAAFFSKEPGTAAMTFTCSRSAEILMGHGRAWGPVGWGSKRKHPCAWALRRVPALHFSWRITG